VAGVGSSEEGRIFFGRTLARCQALQLLFQAEACGRTVEDVLAGDYAVSQGPLDEYGRDLALGTFSCIPELDHVVANASERWEVSRMPAVDRNLMRVAVYEILHVDEVPVAVTIDESVELAKAYGSDESYRFINGLLGRVARRMDEGVDVIAAAHEEMDARKAAKGADEAVVEDVEAEPEAESVVSEDGE
jgi:N utilization substance protein B